MNPLPYPPPTPPTPADYAALRRYLDSPPPTVIADWPEFLHPHDAPDDPEWPPLKSRDKWQDVFGGLGVAGRLVGTIVAMEMALNAGVIEAEITASIWPRIEAFREALNDIDRLPDVVLRLDFSPFSAVPYSAHVSPTERFLSTISSQPFGGLCWLVDGALKVRNTASGYFGNVTGDWWRRVRARVPLHDVAQAAIDGQARVLADMLFSPARWFLDVASVLRSRMDAATVAEIGRRLADEDAATRERAVHLFAELPHPAAVPLLQRTLASDDSLGVRRAATKAMENLVRALDGVTDAVVAVLHDALADRNAIVRVAALAAMQSVDHPDVRAMEMAALADRAQAVRVQAVSNLQRHANAPAVREAFQKILAIDKLPVKLAVVQAMGWSRDAAFVAPLTAVLESATHADLQLAVIQAMLRIGGAGIVAPLVAFLPRATHAQVVAIADALGTSNSADAIAPLTVIANDAAHAWAAGNAVASLGQLGLAAALPSLAALLDAAPTVSTDANEHRCRVVYAIGKSGCDEAVDILTALHATLPPLETDPEFGEDARWSRSVPAAVFNAMALNGTPRACRWLLDQFRTADRPRREAITRALISMRGQNDPAIHDLLALAFTDDSATVRTWATFLTQHRDTEIDVTDFVLPALGHANPQIRQNAVGVVQAKKLTAAREPLRTLLADSDADVRTAARAALEFLEGANR